MGQHKTMITCLEACQLLCIAFFQLFDFDFKIFSLKLKLTCFFTFRIRACELRLEGIVDIMKVM